MGLLAFLNRCITIEYQNDFGCYSSVSGKHKVDYKSMDTARLAARAMSKKRGCVFSAYYCPTCGGFHIVKD